MCQQEGAAQPTPVHAAARNVGAMTVDRTGPGRDTLCSHCALLAAFAASWASWVTGETLALPERPEG